VDTTEIALWQKYDIYAKNLTAGCCKAERSRHFFFQLYDLLAKPFQGQVFFKAALCMLVEARCR
jgi:hypothetical protein